MTRTLRIYFLNSFHIQHIVVLTTVIKEGFWTQFQCMCGGFPVATSKSQTQQGVWGFSLVLTSSTQRWNQIPQAKCSQCNKMAVHFWCQSQAKYCIYEKSIWPFRWPNIFFLINRNIIVIILYITFLVLIYLVIGSLHLLTTFLQSPSTLALQPPSDHKCDLLFYEFFFFSNSSLSVCLSLSDLKLANL